MVLAKSVQNIDKSQTLCLKNLKSGKYFDVEVLWK